jgi:hypothetical protein
MKSFSFIDQFFQVEPLVALAEFLQQSLTLLTSDASAMAFMVIKPLQTHQKPSAFFDTNAASFDYRAIEQYNTVGIGKVEVVRDGCVRLRICPMYLECCQMCKEDRTGVCVCSLALGACGGICRRMEAPLQEVDVRSRALASFESLR